MKKNKINSKTITETQDAFLTSPWRFIEWIGVIWACFVTYKCLNQTPIQIQVFESLLPVQFSFPTLSILLIYVKALLIWCGIVLGSFAVGYLLLSLLKFEWNSSLENFVFSVATGFASNSLFILFLAACHIMIPFVLFLQWLTIVTLFIILMIKNETVRNVARESFYQFIDIIFGKENSVFLKISLILFLCFSFIMTFVPELFYDTLVYHLGVPNLYLRENGLVRIPGVTSRFPLLWQLLYSFGLAFTDEIVPKLLHWTSGLLIVMGSGTLAKRMHLPRVGLLSALFFISIPMVQMNIWAAGIDIGSCLYSFLAIYSVLAWVGANHNNENMTISNYSWIFAAALMSGFSYGSKYQGGIVAVCVFVVFLFSHFLNGLKNFRVTVKHSFIFSVVLFFSILPWLIKNFWDTGNPVFPFLNSLFERLNLQTIHMDTEQLKRLMDENRRFLTTSWKDYWKLPWNFVFNDRNQSSLSYPGPIFLALLPLSLLSLKNIRQKWIQAGLLFMLIFFAFSLSSTHLTRYHLPGFPILCFFYACGISYLWFEKNWVPKITVIAVIAILALQNLQFGIVIVQNSYKPWDVLSGRESREDYRMYSHPGLNPYPSNIMYRWIEKNLSSSSRVLLVGESKPFDLRRKHLFTDVFGKNPVVLWARTGDPEKVYTECRNAGITHFLINFMEAYRTYVYRMITFTDEELKTFYDFWDRHVRLTHQEKIPEKIFPPRDWILLYEVLSEDEAQKRGPPVFNPIREIIKLQSKT